jgi:hypothetical protein
MTPVDLRMPTTAPVEVISAVRLAMIMWSRAPRGCCVGCEPLINSSLRGPTLAPRDASRQVAAYRLGALASLTMGP